jgi:hypothetical protein
MRPPVAAAIVMAALLVIVEVAAGCTTGDGEGARYTGRVVSIADSQLCVGPNSSSSTGTCGAIPTGFTQLPRVGQCVSLFAHFDDNGTKLTWTTASLKLVVPDNECSSTASQKRP